MQSAYALVRGSSSAHRIFLNNIIAQIARSVEFFNKISGWFNCIEPYLTTFLQLKRSVQGAYVLVQTHRTISNHITVRIAKCVCVDVFNISSG